MHARPETLFTPSWEQRCWYLRVSVPDRYVCNFRSLTFCLYSDQTCCGGRAQTIQIVLISHEKQCVTLVSICCFLDIYRQTHLKAHCVIFPCYCAGDLTLENLSKCTVLMFSSDSVSTHSNVTSWPSRIGSDGPLTSNKAGK